MSALSWQHRLRRPGWGLLGVGMLAAVLAGGCGHERSAGKDKKSSEVVATRSITGSVIDYQDFTGRLSAPKTVDIRARVSGYLAKSYLGTDPGQIREGDVVREGQVLFEIDPTVYQAALEKAEADVRLYEAQKELLDAQYERNRRLLGTGAVSREEFDTICAQRGQAVANIAASKAMVKTARQNLDWTKVTAPLSGRISRRMVDPGNLVKADDTVLTNIVSQDPVYVYFDVDERTYLDLVEAASPGLSAWSRGAKYPVLMRLANEDEFRHAGTVNFVDNQVSASTGTIRMRGEFPNPKGVLKPGLFAPVRLPIGAPHRAVLVPDEALQSDQGRKYVYVVNDKDEVVYRKVQLGQAIHGLREIKDGLAEGERVVVSGMQRVRPGVQVLVKAQAPPERPESPLGRLLAFEPARRDALEQADRETRRQGDGATGRQGEKRNGRRAHAGG